MQGHKKKKIHLHFFTVSLPKRQILDYSEVKEFADNNFEFDGNGRKFSKWVENTVGKGEIAHYEQFLLFPHCWYSWLCGTGLQNEHHKKTVYIDLW